MANGGENFPNELMPVAQSAKKKGRRAGLFSKKNSAPNSETRMENGEEIGSDFVAPLKRSTEIYYGDHVLSNGGYKTRLRHNPQKTTRYTNRFDIGDDLQEGSQKRGRRKKSIAGDNEDEPKRSKIDPEPEMTSSKMVNGNDGGETTGDSVLATSKEEDAQLSIAHLTEPLEALPVSQDGDDGEMTGVGMEEEKHEPKIEEAAKEEVPSNQEIRPKKPRKYGTRSRKATPVDDGESTPARNGQQDVPSSKKKPGRQPKRPAELEPTIVPGIEEEPKPVGEPALVEETQKKKVASPLITRSPRMVGKAPTKLRRGERPLFKGRQLQAPKIVALQDASKKLLVKRPLERAQLEKKAKDLDEKDKPIEPLVKITKEPEVESVPEEVKRLLRRTTMEKKAKDIPKEIPILDLDEGDDKPAPLVQLIELVKEEASTFQDEELTPAKESKKSPENQEAQHEPIFKVPVLPIRSSAKSAYVTGKVHAGVKNAAENGSTVDIAQSTSAVPESSQASVTGTSTAHADHPCHIPIQGDWRNLRDFVCSMCDCHVHNQAPCFIVIRLPTCGKCAGTPYCVSIEDHQKEKKERKKMW